MGAGWGLGAEARVVLGGRDKPAVTASSFAAAASDFPAIK